MPCCGLIIIRVTFLLPVSFLKDINSFISDLLLFTKFFHISPYQPKKKKKKKQNKRIFHNKVSQKNLKKKNSFVKISIKYI